AARLRTGQILAYHAAGSEIDRKVSVHGIAAVPPGQSHEMGFAIRMKESPVFKQARRPWMIQRGTRPKHALLLIDLFIGDAVVIGDTALGSAAQLLEYLSGLAEGTVF